MKRRYLSLILAVIMCFALALTANAAGASPAAVVDEGDLLTSEEEKILLARLNEVADAYDISVVVVTRDSLGDKSARAFADDYYDYNGFRDDGVLLLVSMENRDWWVSTKGKCIDEIKSDDVGDAIVSYLKSERYLKAFNAFADTCEKAMRPAYFLAAVICLAIGLVIGFVVTGIMRGKLKSVRVKQSASDYICPGSLQLDVSRDLYLYCTHTRRAKPKNNSSSGSHRSSSGSRHGGGGGHF